MCSKIDGKAPGADPLRDPRFKEPSVSADASQEPCLASPARSTAYRWK